MLSRLLASLRLFFRREAPGAISLIDRSALIFIALTTVWYVAAYLHYPSTPNDPKNDVSTWLRWADQMHYLDGAIDLSHGELKPNKYWIGYPILGAPFYPFFPRHAFFVADLLLVLVMLGAFFASCRHFVSRAEALLLVAVSVYFADVLRDRCLVVPWNTMPAYAAIYLVAYLLVFAQVTLRHFAIAAAAIAFALLARPNELVALAPLYLIPALLWRDPRKWRAVAFLGGAVVAVAAVIVSINCYLYQSPTSPYTADERGKFGYAHMGVKIYQLLCDGTFLTGASTLPLGTRPHQILERFPYLLLIGPGLISLVRTRGPVIWALYLSIALTLLFYVTYNWVSDPTFNWNYTSFHYYWWTLPWLTFFTYLSFRQAPRIVALPVYVAALLLPVAAFMVVGFRAEEVAATDMPSSPLVLASSYQDQTFRVMVTAPREVGPVEDLRFYFTRPPDDLGSNVATSPKISVKLNGVTLSWPGDYTISQQGTGPYDVSLLYRDKRIHAGDTITLAYKGTSPLTIQRACLLRVKFAPGAGLRRLLTP